MVKVKQDLVGMKFGRLTVINQADDYISPKGKHRDRWKCKCSCEQGNEIIAMGSSLKRGKTKSCGCLYRETRNQINKKYNDYEIQEDYVIMYTLKGEPFFVDLEDFWKVKDMCWFKTHNGYIVTNKQGERGRIVLHRLIMDCPKGYDVDHIRGRESKNDNRKSNLRIVTRSQNNMNKDKQSNNTSGVRGVSFDKERQKWAASIAVNGKTHHLGRYKNKEDAIKARKEAEEIYFGEYNYSKDMGGNHEYLL
jgi:hypothetical protein